MIYLSLGSNLGDRARYINRAIEEVAKLGIIKAQSSIYETPPWGKEDQPAFLNAAIALETDIEPDNLLYNIKQIETRLGRKEREHWGPREIDIDILFYGDLQLTSQRLTIPHPRLYERGFVLVPLADIAPDFIHPVLDQSIARLLQDVSTQNIKPYKIFD